MEVSKRALWLKIAYLKRLLKKKYVSEQYVEKAGRLLDSLCEEVAGNEDKDKSLQQSDERI